MRKKSCWVADRTPRRAAVVAVDLLDTQRLQSVPRQPRQVSHVFVAATAYEKTARVRLTGLKHSLHLGTHFKRRWAYAWPQPRYDFRSTLKGSKNSLQNTFVAEISHASQAAPPYVGSSDERSISVSEQHGQAVSHHDSAGQLALRGDAGIGSEAVFSRRMEREHVCTMYLLHKNWPGLHPPLQLCAIRFDAAGRVAHMVTKVHAVPRPSGHAAAARGEDSPHIAGYWPVGGNPVKAQSQGKPRAALVEMLARPYRHQTRPWCVPSLQPVR